MTLYITNIVSFSMLVLLSLCSEANVSEQSPSTGFSVDLISREFSPLSPFYNPKATHFERLKDVIHRSNSRLSYLQYSRLNSPSKSPTSISSTLQWSDGAQEYLMKLNIGTPPVEYLVIADTGSDLTWIQCKPCKDCFKQVYPLFDFRKSSSYKTLKCGSECRKYLSISNSTTLCNRVKNKCKYLTFYLDDSYSVGDGATEKLTFGKTEIPNFVFGCGHMNDGVFGDMSSGIVGLGGGPSSLISQLDHIIHGKFSYCMVSYEKNETSTIRFGEGVQVFTPKAVLTPLYNIPHTTLFYVNLAKVIIGNKSFELPWEMTIPQVQPGNIVIDSGTTFTQLPDGAFYMEIVSALKEYIGLKTTDDPNNIFDLCYKTSPKIKVPYIAFQFTGGTLSIPSTSAFIEVASDVTCFSIMPSSGALFLGNILQQNFLVSYDLHKNMVSFLPTDCSKK